MINSNANAFTGELPNFAQLSMLEEYLQSRSMRRISSLCQGVDKYRWLLEDISIRHFSLLPHTGHTEGFGYGARTRVVVVKVIARMAFQCLLHRRRGSFTECGSTLATVSAK